ncbi:hypothetical protein CK203_069559 [Vitis vinifera]|uniref:Uncharacterized protein n=1 Tax=Vitis vinifera TaxID=29760 RepID=A0A438EKU7_VITVI|nr:hypothetical protein CK203_069559 [Vitis vinifera]
MAGGAPFTPGQLVKREIVRKEERRWGLGFVPWSLTCEKGGLHLEPSSRSSLTTSLFRSWTRSASWRFLTPGSPAWKEYVYVAGGCRYLLPAETPLPLPPRPRLPYPRIDGLHICTYRAFIDAVNFYLEMSNTSDLFHIRSFPFRDLFCLCSWRSKAFPSLSFRVSDSL